MFRPVDDDATLDLFHEGRSPPVTAPLDVPGAATEAAPEAVLAGSGTAIAGRSLGQIAWMRLKRDRVAIGGAVLILLLVVMAIVAPLIVSLLGHPPDEFH